MQRITQVAIGAALLTLAFAAAAQKPYTYPSKGQSQAQQSRDDGECYVWAKQNTGIDPASLSYGTASAPAESGGKQVAKGVAVGALAGAAIGGIGGNNVGNAAAKGALVGGIFQGARHMHRENEQKAASAQASQQSQQAMQTFNRAYGACMSGRGYSVN